MLLPNQKLFTGLKSFNSDSVLFSRAFRSEIIVSIPLAKGGGVKVSDFFKISKKGEGARVSRILILKEGLVQLGLDFPILLDEGPKNNLSFGLQHLQAC